MQAFILFGVKKKKENVIDFDEAEDDVHHFQGHPPHLIFYENLLQVCIMHI